MPIKAKYNGSYKDITDLMNVDESIDYVLAKTSSSYKRVYTATRSIEDATPTTFKSIKPGANLTDYRIYGNTSKNILPLSKTPKTETIGDILCEYDGKGTFKFTSNVDNPTYTQDQWFWVPFEEDFDFPVGISDGGHGCIQLNNDFATGYGVTPYFVGFANRDNGEFVSGFNVAGTALNVVDTNYYTEDLEGLPANCIAFQYLQQIGKRTVTIKPALYLDIRTQQPFEPYGESVGDRTGNLFDINSPNVQKKCYYDATGQKQNSTYHDTSDFIPCGANNSYTLSFRVTNDFFTNYGIFVNLWDNQKNFVSNLAIESIRWPYDINKTMQYNITPLQDGYITFNYLYDIGYTTNIMLVEGSTALPYEPYGYKVPVTVEGKNLFNFDEPNVKEYDFEKQSEGVYYIADTGSLYGANRFKLDTETGKQYVFKGVVDNTNISTQLSGYLEGTENPVEGQIFKTGNINIIFTANGKTTLTIFGYKANQSGTVTNLQVYDISITDDTYEPYQPPVTTNLYLPEPLRMVGTEADYIDYTEQKQYIETTDGQEKYVVGLNVDFENKTFTRLADAVGLSKGADFNNFSAFGGRRRCNVADNGTITAYYGDASYTEDGSNGQVMVYQPAFYYKVEPLKTEAQESGIGYHLRNVNYYISNHQGTGFKLHPAFYNEAGDRVDYILLGAYEGCIYDTSANAYITDDAQVMNTSEDKFSSIANVKPASGLSQNLIRPNLETICKNRGDGWHSLDIRIASMEQLLMIIEFGTMNTQMGAGSDGIVSITGNTSYNCASLTGSTGRLGNTSGQAISTISDINGVQTVETANGKTAYSFRGDENPWGNNWKFVHGVNIWGDGTMHGGVPYICKDYNFSESKRTDNYESAGFSVPNENGFINALGYSENFDWLMIPSEIDGDNSLPIGDYTYVTANLSGYRVTLHGGIWSIGMRAGDFCWQTSTDAWNRGASISGRLTYVPQIEKQHIYTTDLDVTLPALPTLPGTNTLSVGTEVLPSKIDITGHIKTISGGS